MSNLDPKVAGKKRRANKIRRDRRALEETSIKPVVSGKRTNEPPSYQRVKRSSDLEFLQEETI